MGAAWPRRLSGRVQHRYRAIEAPDQHQVKPQGTTVRPKDSPNVQKQEIPGQSLALTRHRSCATDQA
jgi:hypothetical protein